MLNTATLPEMLHCLNSTTVNNGAATDASVLERQRAAALKWQQEQLHLQLQQQQCYLNEFNTTLSVPAQAQTFQGLMSLDGPGLSEMILGRSYITHGSCRSGYGLNYAFSRAAGREPAVGAGSTKEATALVAAGGEGRASFKKRKSEKFLQPQVDAELDNGAKMKFACGEEDEIKSRDKHQNNTSNKNKNSTSTKNENKNRDASASTSKENSKGASDVQNLDYIHVRARRGQATDSHSLAERVRREKISERMKYLQDLVPGCNKITGKAGMLDEIINYVQSLQRQVEFLSMKLATVNPRLNINIEDLFAKEVFAAYSAAQLPTTGVSPTIVNQSYLQFNPSVQPAMAPGSSSDLGINLADLNIRRSISSPLLLPDQTFPDSSSFNQVHDTLPWEAEMQNIFAMEYLQQARPNAFPSETYTGPTNEATLKMEI